ncbi:MAG: hypothetical protein K2L93_05010 [Muribaculaceae bacterium]|nr:hypothetical protein [Muribaculaceae bacterium]MDE6321641.1 hypothetical protein [Muribaculaceae bacterium]
MIRTVATYILILASLTVVARDALDIRGAAVIDAATVDVATLPYLSNPAAMFTRFEASRSTFNAVGSYSGADESLVVQEGSGHLLGGLSADSYMRYNSSTVVWGGAKFSTGQLRNLKWTESIDYDRIAPYVLGDSVGGNLSERRYSFYGGYAGRSGRWGWGAKASYQASIDYRDRDPRDKIVVSDLNVDLGVTRTLGNYDLGAALGLNVYNQDCDLEFYNPVNNIRVYVFTGLGTVYNRFSGNSAENAAYDGLGYRMALTLTPIGGDGAWGAIRYRHDYMKQILRDFNNITLSHATSYHCEGEAGWKGSAQRLTIAPRAMLKWRRRIGTENLFGSSVGTDYNYIGHHTYYYSDCVTALLDVPMTIAIRDNTSLDIVPGGFYFYEHENYRTPSRDLEADRLGVKLQAALAFDAGSVRLRPCIEGVIDYASSLNCKLTGLNPVSPIGEMVYHNFDMLIADSRSLGVSLGASYNMTHAIALQIEAKARRSWISGHGKSTQAIVTAGVVF